MEIYDVFVLFYRRKWLVLLILSMSIGANAWILSVEPRRFESTAVLKLSPQASATISNDVIVGVPLFQPFTLGLLQQLVDSTDFQEAVRQRLADDPDLLREWNPGELTVTPRGSDGLILIDVAYVGTGPEISRRLLEVATMALDAFSQSWFEQGLQRAHSEQQQLVDRQSQELEKLDKDLALLRESAELSEAADDVSAFNQTLLAQIAALENERLSLAAEAHGIRSRVVDASPSTDPAEYETPLAFLDLLDGLPMSQEIRNTALRLYRAEVKVAELSKEQSDVHPELKSARVEAESIRATFDSYLEPGTPAYAHLQESLVHALRNHERSGVDAGARLRQLDFQLAATDRLIAEKQSVLDRIRDFEKPIAGLSRQQRRLESDLDRDSELLASLEKTSSLAPDVVGIFQSVSAGRPVGKKLQAFAGAIVLLGLVLAVGAVYGLEMFDHRLHNQHDVRKHSGLPLLAIIPDTSKSGEPDMIVSGRASSGPTGEAFSSLAKKMLVGLDESDRVLVVTGPDAAAGKTFVSANLGLAASRLGVRTLVVDADLRQPRLHELFQVGRDPGLSELLAGELDPGELLRAIELSDRTDRPLRMAWRDLERTRGSGSFAVVAEPSSQLGPTIQLTETLSVVTAGSADVDPVAALSSERARSFFAAARERFDFIVVDTPPLNVVSDALVLSDQVDAYLQVVRASQSTSQDLHWAKQGLEDVGATMAGVVLNALQHRVPGYYTYYDGRRYYRARG